jgi:O-antigen/teichoic acid export membrane protein/GR25 family glycosyltransferase involved in LPS biosynthesis
MPPRTPEPTLSDYFQCTYIVNLPERKDRRKAVLEELQLIGMPLAEGKVEIFHAWKPAERAGFPSVEARGRFLSHLAVLKKAHRLKLKNVLVLEDDLAVDPALPRHIDRVLVDLQKQPWGILYLGHLESVSATGIPRLIPYDRPVITSHFYAVNGPVLPRLITFLETLLDHPVDHPLGSPTYFDSALTLFRRQNPDVVTMIVEPSLGEERPSYSSIGYPNLEDLPPILQAQQAALKAARAAEDRRQNDRREAVRKEADRRKSERRKLSPATAPPAKIAEPKLQDIQLTEAAAIAEDPLAGNPIADTPVELGALESKAVSASFWTMLSYGSAVPLRLINSLLLTRLLAPQFYGEVTLVITFVTGINMLSDIGLGPSVIQSKRGDDATFLNTAWTLQVMRGAFIALIALIFSWPLSLFYHDPKLAFLLPAVALAVFMTGFNSTSLLTASRHMGVRRLFALDISTQVLTMIVTMIWAFIHPSAWAIIGGTLAADLYRLILSHTRRVMPGIRNRFQWDKDSVHEIVHFGKWIMVGTAFFFFATQSDRLILGKLVPIAVLGVYGLAFQLSDMPRQVINALSAKVGYPFIAKIIDLPREEFRRNFLRYRGYALMGGSVLLSLMIVWGGPIVLRIYDKRYADAAWMVPILAIGLWHTLLYTTTSPVLFSLGKSKYNAVGNAVYCAAIVGGIPAAFYGLGHPAVEAAIRTLLPVIPATFHSFALMGAVAAVAAGDFPFYLVTQYGAVREGINPLRQDLQMTTLFLALLTLFLAIKFLLLGHIVP